MMTNHWQGKTPQILIADDAIESLRLISRVLRDKGYEVRSVTTGTLALSSIQEARPDLILLDILMPDKSGYEVCQAIKADPETHHIPVIFLSALNETIDKVKAFDVGGIDFISKPFQVEEVTARVQNQLELCFAQTQLLKLNVELEERVKYRTAQLETLNHKLSQEISYRIAIEQTLRASEEKFRQISEHVSQVFWLTGYNATHQTCTELIYVSPGYEKIWGISLDEMYRSPWLWREVIYEQDRGRVEHAFRHQAMHGTFDEEYRIIRPDGDVRWIHDRGFPVTNSEGTVYRIAGIAQDITAQKQAEVERDRFFRLSLDLLFIANHRGKLKRTNPEWARTLGYAPDDLFDQPLWTFVHPEDKDVVLTSMQSLRQGQDINGVEVRLRHQDGSDVWTAWNIVTFPKEQLIYGTGRNITKRKEAEDALVYKTLHDSLTGLDNRMCFVQRLEIALKKCYRKDTLRFAVLFIDLDGFKGINDTLGHAIGDQLLIHVAHILQHSVRETDSVARLGGDEFTILLEDLQNLKQVIDIVERIQAHLKDSIHLDHHKVYTSASIGIVLGTPDHENIADILRNADIAMYRAKAKGKACYEVFDRDMYVQTLHLVEIENHLRHAIQNNELQLYYQPIINLEQCQPTTIEGVEVLLRWFHPQKGLISPNEFIPIAEDTGLINTIGEWVLHQSCAQLKQWEQQWPVLRSLYLSVNLSGHQLRESTLPHIIENALQQGGLSPHRLRLEITETSLVEASKKTAQILDKIRANGTSISLDDFGTGFSSFSYLHQFPIDVLKIDRSFMRRLTQGEREQNIVHSIITLARNLGMKTVAEGIETHEQLHILTEMACNAGQGFLFAKPMALPKLNQFLSSVLQLGEPQGIDRRSPTLGSTPLPFTQENEDRYQSHR